MFPSLDIILGFYFFRAKKQKTNLHVQKGYFIIYLFDIFPSFYSYFVLQNVLFLTGLNKKYIIYINMIYNLQMYTSSTV